MVDVITNRMFDTFNRYAPRDTHQNDSLSTISNLKRFSADQKYRKAQTREQDAKARNAHLFDIKENTPPVSQPKQRPVTGLSCSSCTPSSRDSLANKSSKNLALKNIINYTPAHKKFDFLHRTFNHLSQVYELKKYPYPQVEGTVLRDERIKHAIEKTAFQQFQDTDGNDDSVYQHLLKRNEKRARALLHDMRSTLSDFLLRFTSWVLYKLLPCFMSSVVVHPGHVDMLKQASQSNLPMIFLPLHRSHLDYILMSFILLNNDIRSPLVASGDNLRIPFFGSLLRGLGAFFIKRRIDPIMGRKDHLYKAVLHTYMNESLRAGHNIEFFLEGGRTRTGKPCMPKYGILSVIVEAFMDGTIEDALLVPVSINYEKLVDGNFVREQLGQPKEMETFGAAIKGIWNVLNCNHGMMRIDFNQPFSLRELVKTFNTNGRIPDGFNKKLKSNPSTTSLYGTDIVSDEHKSLVESISKHVIYDCARSQAIMSTNALAFLLLNKFRNGVKVSELVDAMDDLKYQLLAKDRDIGYTGDSLDVINYAIDILGPALVRKEQRSMGGNNSSTEDVIKPVSMLPNVIELAYYSNAMMTCYALESVVANAFYSLELQRPDGSESGGVIRQDDLVQAAISLCNYLQYEFIFCKPCQSLEANILDCIQDLITRHECFTTINNDVTADTYRSRRLAQDLFDDEDEQSSRHYVAVEYVINTTGSAHLQFLRGLLMPLVEGYAITAFCLDKLVGRTLLENELVTNIIEEMKTQLQAGTLHYEESVSVDPVKNALKIYQKLEMLECHSEKKLRLYYLKDTKDNSQSVTEFYQQVNKYRHCCNTVAT